MHPHRSAVGIRAMLALVPIVWAISIAMAAPMAIWKKLEYWTDMPMNHLFDDDNAGSVPSLQTERLHWVSNTSCCCSAFHCCPTCLPCGHLVGWMQHKQEVTLIQRSPSV